MNMKRARSFLILLVWWLAQPAWALDDLVEKKTFSLASFTVVGGQTIKNVRIGYETYGKLNTRKDNAIFIAHMFLGTSHAAGKYKVDDAQPGYWDAIIGPSLPIDTNRYFVVSADTLAHTNARDPNVITTGPASINPDTGKAYGLAFPMVALRDSVRVHKALLDSLGVRKLHAVAGWSMGAMQAFDWAAAYPDFVERVIAVGGSAQPDGYAVGWLNAWSKPVLLDPKWRNGDYYTSGHPEAGLAAAIEILVQTVGHHQWIDSAFGRKWAEEGKDPRVSLEHKYLWEQQLAIIGRQYASIIDANSYLLTLKAIQGFTAGQADTVEEGLKKIRAATLAVGVPTDVIVVEPTLKRDVEILQRNNVRAQYIALEGAMGHLEGQFGIAKVGEKIRDFLDK
jgi:homoserine O-acetyltransferase/O-succinyltransferase